MIRIASSEDYPHLLDIQVDCINNLNIYTADERQAWIKYIQQEGVERYGKYDNCVYETDGRVVGFVSWSHNDQSSAIECLYVLEKFRGQNIGRALLREAEINLPAGSTVHIRSTINAAKFYEKNGYRRTGEAISRAGFGIILFEKNL